MARKKLDYIEIPVNIYRRTVVVFFGATAKEMCDFGKSRGIRDFSEESLKWMKETIAGTAMGFTLNYGDDNPDILVWLRIRPRTASQFGVLYHELYHAVDFIASHTDEKNKWYSEDGMSEPRAFLFEYLANECNRKLWK